MDTPARFSVEMIEARYASGLLKLTPSKTDKTMRARSLKISLWALPQRRTFLPKDAVQYSDLYLPLRRRSAAQRIALGNAIKGTLATVMLAMCKSGKEFRLYPARCSIRLDAQSSGRFRSGHPALLRPRRLLVHCLTNRSSTNCDPRLNAGQRLALAVLRAERLKDELGQRRPEAV